MGVVNTYEWLQVDYETPEKICERFRPYIPLATSDMYKYLRSRGMYTPYKEGLEEVEKLREKKVWKVLQKEYVALRKWLQGPDVPIFILPVDRNNKHLAHEYKGKTGLAFSTCIFLFVSAHNDIGELKAMLTHEYHHVSRLHVLKQEDESYTLLDTMVFEGLAEAAVAERHTETYHAVWVSYYTKKEMQQFWSRFLRKNVGYKRGTRPHEELLHGFRSYPNMLGYCMGYHLVKDCMENRKWDTKKMLGMEATEIVANAPAFNL